MEALSEYFVLALLVLMFSVPVLINLYHRFRGKNEHQDEAGEG